MDVACLPPSAIPLHLSPRAQRSLDMHATHRRPFPWKGLPRPGTALSASGEGILLRRRVTFPRSAAWAEPPHLSGTARSGPGSAPSPPVARPPHAAPREYPALNHSFAVSLKDYDYSKPTCEVYATTTRVFTPAYAEVRKELDYSYHPYYTLERQRYQDYLVSQALGSASRPRPRRPWILFTAGPMAVGKGHVMRYFDRQGWVRQRDYVQSLPDWFREQLPEYEGYVAFDPKMAGIRTQREVGMLAEIVTNEALRRGHSLVVDGSLRDAEYHRGVFARLRERFPQYRIGIVAVWAEPETIRRRAQARERLTGRRIPEDLLTECIEAVPQAVHQLAPLVDFLCEVNNDGPQPRLLPGLCKGGGCTYDTLPEVLSLDEGT